LLAFAVSVPSFGQKTGNSDDSATITQVDGGGNIATQHQPGGEGNTAAITQTEAENSTAMQEQWRNLNGVDFAVGGKQSISQTGTTGSVASQEDNGIDDIQAVTQTNAGVARESPPLPTPPNPAFAPTTVMQTINSPSGTENSQTSTQNNTNASGVSQTLGVVAPGTFILNNNSQTATQSGQTFSNIAQMVDGASNSNSQTATESGPGTLPCDSASACAVSFNTISQTILASDGDKQTASITGRSGFNGTFPFGAGITQLQQTGSHNDTQTASINNGSTNLINQLQDANSSNNIQIVTVDDSGFGVAVQYQGVGVSGGSETINQTGGGSFNSAGQAQGNDGSIALINQTGGMGNVAIQNQGLLPGQAGFILHPRF